MMPNRWRRSGRGFVTAALLVALTACGGDPAPKTELPTDSSSSSMTSTAPAPSDSTFPPEAPLADGPWIPSPSFKVKVPKGFKGESDFGVTTLRKDDLGITLYDTAGLGDNNLQDAVKTENKTAFTSRTKTKIETGTATVDGQYVDTFVMTGRYSFFKRVAYGFGVRDTDGVTRFVVIGFEGEKDPTLHQDTIDSVLSSIRWNKKVVG